MTDFAPIDGRVGLGGSGGVGSGVERVARERVPSQATPAGGSQGLARQIVDEVELSEGALRASSGVRPEVVARAKERLLTGFYDDPRVAEQAADRLINDLAA